MRGYSSNASRMGAAGQSRKSALFFTLKNPVIMTLLNHLHTQIMLNSTLKMEIYKQRLCSHLY